MIHNGSHTTLKRVSGISLIEDVNRYEPIEIYCLAHVGRKKKKKLSKQQNLFSPFCLNVSSKTNS